MSTDTLQRPAPTSAGTLPPLKHFVCLECYPRGTDVVTFCGIHIPAHRRRSATGLRTPCVVCVDVTVCQRCHRQVKR